MENIRKAVQLARARDVAGGPGDRTQRPSHPIPTGDDRTDLRIERRADVRPEPPRAASRPEPRTSASGPRHREVVLDAAHLEAHRIVAHDIGDPRSKSFDMLRTQVLRTMDLQNWQCVAVTSPTAGCGKTLTALNLALGIARQPERSVLLVDLDLQKPQVARCLGIRCERGLVAAVTGRALLADALVDARIGVRHLTVLPIEAPTSHSSELVASRAMNALLQDLRREFPSHTVILDMPPMLVSDEVITLLPRIDCVLLVAAVGTTTPAEIAECNRHLQAAEVVRLVVNKVPGTGNRYYY